LTGLFPLRYYLSFSILAGLAAGWHHHEADVSTESAAPEAYARVSRADEHEERTSGAETAPREGAKAPDRFGVPLRGATPADGGGLNPPRHSMPLQTLPRARRLRRRTEFQRVFDTGRRVHGRYFTIIASAGPSAGAADEDTRTSGAARLGIVASRRLGGAVVRNRAKRLTREVFRTEAPIRPALDLIVIPKPALLDAPWSAVQDDFRATLRRFARPASK
jgi:ribonuclease P protein component